jgi:SAM-dependent methyltransferase
MSRLANILDFEQGGLYDSYRRYEFFTERKNLLAGRLNNPNLRILIAGCGFGYLVDELISIGYANVWGCDASQYAIDKANELLPANVASHILLGDCTSSQNMQSVKSAAGIRGQQKFDICVTEDMLTVCDNEAEVQTVLTTLRAISNTLAHILTCIHPEIPGDVESKFADLLWHTQQEWRTIINANSEWCYDVELKVIFLWQISLQVH